MDSRVGVYVENKAGLDERYSFGSVVFRIWERKGEIFQSENQRMCSPDEIRGCLPEVSKIPIVSPTVGDETTLL